MVTTDFDNNCRFHLAIGYGDDYWDDGQDDYFSDSLEELWELMPENDLTLEKLTEIMATEGYYEDPEFGMWYIRDEKNS